MPSSLNSGSVSSSLVCVRPPPVSNVSIIPHWKSEQLFQRPEVHGKLEACLETVGVGQFYRDAVIDAMCRQILECITDIE